MATITTNVGSPGTISRASGGRTLAFNAITTTPVQVLGANPQRQSITVHNPGTNTIYFAPMFVQNTGSDVALTPTTAALGGCILVGPGLTQILTGEVQKPYQAFANAGSTNPLTIIDSNI